MAKPELTCQESLAAPQQLLAPVWLLSHSLASPPPGAAEGVSIWFVTPQRVKCELEVGRSTGSEPGRLTGETVVPVWSLPCSSHVSGGSFLHRRNLV